MPSGRLDPDGTLRFNMSYAKPYTSIWANATLLPFLETNLGVTQIGYVQGFSGDTTYGNYKDKVTGLKLRILDEDGWRPSLVVGAQDFVGTGLFRRNYLAAGKTWGDVDVTLGYGSKLINGAYGGFRYTPSSFNGSWSIVGEYDANDYANHPFSSDTGIARRTPGISYGLEYHWEWITAAVSNQRGDLGVSASLAIPLDRKAWIPKLTEPEPYATVTPRPTVAMWNDDRQYRVKLFQALIRQDFKDVRIRLAENRRLELALTNSRISKMSRAVGRAVRTALLLSPLDINEIRVTYTSNTLPVATYDFFDLQRLNRYFNGMLQRRELAEFVEIKYASPGPLKDEDRDELMTGLAEPVQTQFLFGEDANFVGLKTEDIDLNVFGLRPYIRTYLNGPSAFQYIIDAEATYQRRLADKTFLNASVAVPIDETISKGITQPDNTTLPVVRSDLPDYRKSHHPRVERLLINDYYHLSERTYGRLSAGLYEEMYGGFGGQWLYVPKRAQWALDVAVDELRKRDFEGRFGFKDYQTTTAIASFHYKMPFQSTATIRAGRFLAKDEGARIELKRRFQIGFELGAWYTVTNANDRGGPAAQEGGVYYDKGVFISVPFEPLLTKDTKAVGYYSLSPWGRDPGQLVVSPGDLYSILERPLIWDLHERDGLVRFGDMEDDYDLPDLGSSVLDRPFERIGAMTVRDWGKGAGSLPSHWDSVLTAGAVVLGAAVFDRRLARFVDEHGKEKGLHRLDSLGKTLPFLGMGLAGMATLAAEDKRLSDTGLASLQAGMTGLLANYGLKYAVGRARPVDQLGPADFRPFDRKDASFPSNHSTLIWAAVTPFAEEYQMPWLYGVAAMTNFGRIASKQHWLSDTVASSFIGYGIGTFFWEQRRKPEDKGPKIVVAPNGVTAMWEFQ